MAKYFVSQSGSNTAPYDTWAKAATSLATALAAASASGDVIALDAGNPPTTDKELAADTTYTFAATNVMLVASTNSGTSTITATTMGTSQWIGNSTTNRSITFASAAGFRNFVYGLTLRISGTGADSVNCSSSGSTFVYGSVYFWIGNSNGASGVNTGGTTGVQSYVRHDNCTYRFGSTGQSIFVSSGMTRIYNGVLSTDGSAPTVLFDTLTTTAGSTLFCEGCDWTHSGSGFLVGDFTGAVLNATMSRCKLGTGFAILEAQSDMLAGAHVYLFDCSTGDTHGLFAYADALGSAVTDTAITYTGSPTGQSWKIVTTANASGITPFRTPFVDRYNSGTSAVTPRFEILRDGSTTAYTDAEVWAEFEIKATSGNVLPTAYSDRQSWTDFASGTAGTAQATGAGLGSWTGESGTAWSGKIDTGSAVTPAEVGEMRGRICVAAASATVYVDPFIRT